MEQSNSETISTRLRLSNIIAGYNPRRYFDKKGHEELVTSLRLRGMLQPMLVRPTDDPRQFVIVAGGRRYRAALEAFGPDAEVPVFIRDMTDQEALEAAIDENDVREDASETEQADAAVKMLAATGNDKAEATRRLGWSSSKFDRRIALASLDPAVKTALDERVIKVGHAELLAAVPADKQAVALSTIVTNKLDVAKTRDILLRMTQDLGTAIFDKADCAACTYNSSTQAVLFEAHVTSGHCTNANCFAIKTAAAEQLAQQLAQAQASQIAAAPAPTPSGVDTDVPAAADTSNDTNVSNDAPEASASPVIAKSADRSATATTTNTKPAATPKAAPTVSIDHAGIIKRAIATKQETWRKALAQFLAVNPRQAQELLVTVAFNGTITHTRNASLMPRANALLAPRYASIGETAQLAAVCALSDDALTTAVSAIAAAFVMDCHSFPIVERFAKRYAIDIAPIWTIDATYLGMYTKEELRCLGQEFGLVDFIGAKAFSKMLNAKKGDIISSMLSVPGFTWKGILPAAMTLDGKVVLVDQIKPDDTTTTATVAEDVEPSPTPDDIEPESDIAPPPAAANDLEDVDIDGDHAWLTGVA